MSYRKPVNFPNLVTGELRQGDIQGTTLGVHSVGTKQLNELGTRYRIGDKIYRYGKSSGVCRAGRGCLFDLNIGLTGPDYKLLSQSQAIGDMEITITANTHPAYAKNALAGGQILISDSEIAGSDLDPQNRTIAGNVASAANALLKVYLDTPLSRAVGITTYAFLMPSSYGKLICGSDGPSSERAGYSSHAGVPAAYVNAANKFFWVQTWGPLWVAFQGAVGKTEGAREVCFRWDGTIGDCTDDDATEEYQQRCGFVLDRTDAGVGATFIMLQVNP